MCSQQFFLSLLLGLFLFLFFFECPVVYPRPALNVQSYLSLPLSAWVSKWQVSIIRIITQFPQDLWQLIFYIKIGIFLHFGEALKEICSLYIFFPALSNTKCLPFLESNVLPSQAIV